VLRVCDRLALGHLADQPLAALGNRDDRRSDPATLDIRNDDRLATLHNRHARVCRAEVNSDYFSHLYLQLSDSIRSDSCQSVLPAEAEDLGYMCSSAAGL